VFQFITGSSRLPHGGFSQLKPKIKIRYLNILDHLPFSHICFNTLDLPDYPSKVILKEKLTTAVISSKDGGGLEE
jgi:hypothetical protein